MQYNEDRQFWVSLGRAFAGALLFSLPLLMTMEMWWLGFYLNTGRLLLFLLVLLPLLIVLSYFSGFETTGGLSNDVGDGLIAFGVGIVTSALFLFLLGILNFDMPLNHLVGQVALLSFPASIGAVLASKQFAQEEEDSIRKKSRAGYWGELFMMAAGAIFIGFNVAPTEEMVVIAYKMTPWHAVGLVLVSLMIMHALVFSVGFKGQEAKPEGGSFWQIFRNFTVVGYVISLLVSAYLLWTFDRFADEGLLHTVMSIVVLGFPSAVGAAVSRIVI